MKLKYIAAMVASSLLVVGAASAPSILGTAQANSDAVSVKACAGNPCAANPCAANPCAANPCAANPCAANPCASSNPCAGNPCAATALQPRVYSYEGLAIRGADPVAYFTEGAAVKGSADFEYTWNGATWHFSSAANLDTFKANPEAYAPQYGGYCAKAVSEGNLASIDPEAWRIVDGKLYLQYSPAVQDQWSADVAGSIANGDRNWDGVLANEVVYESGIAW